jgi:hypothetical protein
VRIPRSVRDLQVGRESLFLDFRRHPIRHAEANNLRGLTKISIITTMCVYNS